MSELWLESKTVNVEADITVTFLDEETISFQVGVDEDGMWPLVNYTPFGLLVKFSGGNEQFIPWTAIRSVLVSRIY